MTTQKPKQQLIKTTNISKTKPNETGSGRHPATAGIGPI